MVGKKLRSRLFGFKKSDVFSYICEMDERTEEKLSEKNYEIEELKNKIADLEKNREAIIKVLQTAETKAAEVVEEANKRAEEIIGKAEEEVRQMKENVNREIEIKRKAVKSYYVNENKKIDQIRGEVDRMRESSLAAIRKFEEELRAVSQMTENSSAYVRTAIDYAENGVKLESFDDVEADRWSNEAIATLAKAAIINGRTGTVFAPEASITRAEFATIAARFDSEPYTAGEDMFNDISGHWAAEYINRAATRGWVTGDGNGTFRPDDYITRAEAATLINRVLERNPETAEDLLDTMIKFPDNADVNAWYYLNVQEASNDHDYVRKEDGVHESWVSL